MAEAERILIGLGSNLGDRRGHLARALAALAAVPGLELVAVSRLHVTAAWGGPEGQGDFLNAAAVFLVRDLEPRELLTIVQEIEDRSGRVRTVKNGPRTLDLDILLWGDRVVDEGGLLIPHEGLHERSFVLGPAADVAPDARHPVRAETVASLAREVGDAGILEVLEERDWFHAVGHPSP